MYVILKSFHCEPKVLSSFDLLRRPNLKGFYHGIYSCRMLKNLFPCYIYSPATGASNNIAQLAGKFKSLSVVLTFPSSPSTITFLSVHAFQVRVAMSALCLASVPVVLLSGGHLRSTLVILLIGVPRRSTPPTQQE